MAKINIALKEGTPLPFQKHKTDFCVDFVAVSEEEVSPNVWKYGLGIKMDLSSCKRMHDSNDLDEMVISYRLAPRSSIWKTGMVLSNSEGIVDEDFRGEISAVFYHVMPDMPRYKVGDRVCQGYIGFTMPVEFKVVDETKLSKTARGEGGYGSTGK